MPRQTAYARHAVAESASALQGVIDSAEELLESVRDLPGSAADRLREKVSATANIARDRLSNLTFPRKGPEALDAAAGFVHGDPWRTATLGVASALAVSLILHAVLRD